MVRKEYSNDIFLSLCIYIPLLYYTIPITEHFLIFLLIQFYNAVYIQKVKCSDVICSVFLYIQMIFVKYWYVKIYTFRCHTLRRNTLSIYTFIRYTFGHKTFGRYTLCTFRRWVWLMDWYYWSHVYGWINGRHSESFLWSMINTIDQKYKSLTNGSIMLMKNETDSIDWYYRYRSIDPSLIVPRYGIWY